MRPIRWLTPVVCLVAVSSGGEDRFMAALPPESEVQVRRDIEYVSDTAGRAAFDLYRPARASALPPVVVFMNGIGANWMRSHVQYTSWARAVTARGLAGVTMDAREGRVEEDVRGLVAHLAAHAAELGVDGGRVAFWTCSANVTRGLPLVDALIALGLRQNAPVEALNVAAGVHGFDLRDDDEASRAAIRRTLDFLEATLAGGVSDAARAGASRSAAAGAVLQGDWPTAAAGWERVVSERPADANAWQRLGEARRQVGDRAGTLAAFEKALALGSPNRGQIGFAMAGIHAEAGDVDRAVASLEGMGRFLRFFREPLETAPAFATVRRDPRVAKLLAALPAPPGR